MIVFLLICVGCEEEYHEMPLPLPRQVNLVCGNCGHMYFELHIGNTDD